MIRSALIIGAVSFVYLLFANVAQMLCVPFLVILLGLSAGILAGIFDKPQQKSKAVTSGALAGLIASVGAVAGSAAGLAIRIYVIFTPETFVNIIPNSAGAFSQSDLDKGIFSVFCCCLCSVFFLMAASGALGGFAGFQYKNRKPAVPPSQPPLENR
jgi:hypothetical protein